MYSPTSGRFLQTDPIGYEGQFNLYAYVNNDPINGSDPTGEDSFYISRAAGGTLGLFDHGFVVVADKAGGEIKEIFSYTDIDGNLKPSSFDSSPDSTLSVDRAAWNSIATGDADADGVTFNRVDISDKATEAAVIRPATDYPAYGQARTSNELRKQGIFVSPSGVRSIWLRHDLANFKKRLKALEAKVAKDGIILTEAQVQALEKKKHDDEACGEIETAHPGYLGSQDTFYVGIIKGVGRVYQQTNGICERFHKTILQEFYQVTFRKNLYDSIKQLQADLDEWLDHYNTQRTHQGKMCCGRTPLDTMIEGKAIWKEKVVDQI